MLGLLTMEEWWGLWEELASLSNISKPALQPLAKNLHE
jgi:hypothetical protein